MALADIRPVAMLTNGIGPPILLGSIRQYPEEKSRFILDFSGFGSWNVRAICPGLSVGKDYKLSPLDADVYLGGFPRWTFSSEASSLDASNMLLSFEYERFKPKYKVQKPTRSDDVIKDWHIEGTVRFEYGESGVSNIFPTIREASLPVWDFRGRKAYTQAGGGYDRDYLFQFVTTNQSWTDQERVAIKGEAVTELGVHAIAEKKQRFAIFRWLFFPLAAVVFALPLLFALKRSANKLDESAKTK
jgi:hypothetical protein